MEETGIIRRLDALGRIVIPREFRKLNRIEVGDPIEMRALSNGEIIIRKVDISAQLRSVGLMALAPLSEHTDKLIGVCSADKWLEFSRKCALSGEELPEHIAKAADSRKSSFIACEGLQCGASHAAVYPIFGETGIFGAYVLFTDSEPTPAEKSLLETVAAFTGKTLQKF